MLQGNASHGKLLLQLLNVVVQPAKVQALVYSKQSIHLKSKRLHNI